MITISATTVNASTSFPGSTCTLRIYSDKTFTADDDTPVMRGSVGSGAFFKSVPCTISNGIISIPSFTIPPTTSALDDDSAKYTAIFYDSKGIKRDVYFTGRVTDTFGAVARWSQQRLFNHGRQPIRDLVTYTKQEVNVLIATAVGSLNDASDVVKGRAYSDVPPAIASAPTFVALNSRRTGFSYNVTSTAIGAVGNGIANDRAALDTLVNTTLQITGAGGEVLFPPGTYLIGSNMTFPSNVRLNFDPRAMLKSANGVTITILGEIAHTKSQIFSNALASQGTISFGSIDALYPEWWATNATPGTTDMTAAIQAAITATGGRGKVLFSTTSYLITATLRLPTLTDTFAPLTLEGEGRCLSNLINKASAGKPTLLIDRGLVTVRGVGFWGDANFPNDGIKVSTNGSRVFIEDGNSFYMQGNGIFIEQAHSIWIRNNIGAVSGGSGLRPVGVTNPIVTYTSGSAFVYVSLPNGGFANHVVIRDNLSEGYDYPVLVSRTGSGTADDFTIEGNQFEGSANGITLVAVNNLKIEGNYLSEGGTGFAIDLDNCRYVAVGENHIHFVSNDAKSSTVKLNEVYNTELRGYFPRILITGTQSDGLTCVGAEISRIQDEVAAGTRNSLTLVNCSNTSITIPKFAMNRQSGRATWYSDTTAVTLYPYVRLGDTILKVTPVSGASPGWVCTTASSTGALVQVTGSGPSPTVPTDYYDSTAYDYRITILTGGVTGTATYKVEWKTAGGGSYVDLTNTITTTELARLIQRETGVGSPASAFSIKWPTAQTYVSGNQWTLTGVVAPVWKALPAIA